jgi:hypothetical protein
VNAPGEKAEIRKHRDHAARDGYARLVEHVREKGEGNSEEQRGQKHGFVRDHRTEHRGTREIYEDQRADDNAVDDHLMLAVGAILEAALEEADQREARFCGCGHGVPLTPFAPASSAG